MTENALRDLSNLSELDFTLNRVKPIFEGLGYQGVKYVGGANPPERGRDVIFYEIEDKLLMRKDMAAQVKKGNMNASKAAGLLSQIDEAFNFPHVDPQSGEPKRICHLFVVVSGKIQQSVIERVQRERPLLYPFITFWDGEQVLQNERIIRSNLTRITGAEKLIHTLGLDKLFTEDQFIENVSRTVEKMFKEMNLSELRVVAELPAFLLTLPEVKDKVEVLSVVDQKEVLLCLAIMIVTKSNLNLGVNGKYGIWNIKRIGT
jgi:hypothetical protein